MPKPDPLFLDDPEADSFDDEFESLDDEFDDEYDDIDTAEMEYEIVASTKGRLTPD